MIHDMKQNVLSPAVYEIYSQCMYAPSYEKFAEKARFYLDDSSTAIYGFYENSTLLGVIVLQAKAPSTAEIVGIAVEHTHQHRHIGKKLIQHAAAIGRYTELYAETDDDAVTFYERCGFEVEAFQAAYDGIPCKRYRCTYHLS